MEVLRKVPILKNGIFESLLQDFENDSLNTVQVSKDLVPTSIENTL